MLSTLTMLRSGREIAMRSLIRRIPSNLLIHHIEWIPCNVRAKRTWAIAANECCNITRSLSTNDTPLKDTEKEPKAEWMRIYYGTLSERMKMVKVLTIVTSALGLLSQPILFAKGTELGGRGVGMLLCTVASFFTFVTPSLFHFITKKYVVSMDYNQNTDEYRATILSIMLKKIEIKFHVDDVIVPEVPGMFTSFVVHKRPLFIEPTLFEDPEHYVRIMGLDKPIDFKLGSKEVKDPPTTESSSNTKEKQG